MTQHHLPCQVCNRQLVPLQDGTSRRHTPGRPGTGGGEYARCPGSGYRLARWPVGQKLHHHTTGIWEVVEDRGDSTPYSDYLIRCVKPTLGFDNKPMEPVGKDMVAHGEYMHRHGWTPVDSKVANLDQDGNEVPETRARRRIRLALEALGATELTIRWSPIGQMIEMSGREGGWEVFGRLPNRRHESHWLGYRVDDVLADIAAKAGAR